MKNNDYERDGLNGHTWGKAQGAVVSRLTRRRALRLLSCIVVVTHGAGDVADVHEAEFTHVDRSEGMADPYGARGGLPAATSVVCRSDVAGALR